MAARENLSFTLRETWSIAFTLTGLDGVTPLDLSNATAVRFRLGDALIDLTSPAGGVVLAADLTTGQGVVTVEPDDQADLVAGVYPYEIRAEFSGGVKSTQNVGDVTVEPTLF